jgi:hypothetical protein
VSYVRFLEADLYIYHDVNGYVTRCGCRLGEPDFHTTELQAMLEHVGKHRLAGHDVPDDMEQRLREDWPDFGEVTS